VFAAGFRSGLTEEEFEMAEPSGLRIVAIHNANNGAKNTDGEWIQINNEGSQVWTVHNWELTDETERQLRPHIYRFPMTLDSGSKWSFDPGESIYVFTGHGQDAFIAKGSPEAKPQFHFYWNRDAMAWNNSGDRVYLRGEDGRFITVPFPIP
jgi:hypothetical protein